MIEREYKRKIYYHDTDCGDVVYYANYLKITEEARDEYFVESGLSLRELNEEGYWFAVGEVQTKYKGPARFNDQLLVKTSIEKLRSASMDFVQEIYCADKLLNSSKTKVVCVGYDFVPRKIPENVINAFK